MYQNYPLYKIKISCHETLVQHIGSSQDASQTMELGWGEGGGGGQCIESVAPLYCVPVSCDAPDSTADQLLSFSRFLEYSWKMQALDFMIME